MTMKLTYESFEREEIKRLRQRADYFTSRNEPVTALYFNNEAFLIEQELENDKGEKR